MPSRHGSAIVLGSVGGLVTVFFDPPAWWLKGKEQRRNASQRSAGLRFRNVAGGSRECGSTRTSKSPHSDKTTTRERCEGDRCHDPCVRRRNDTVTRTRPIDVPRTERLSDGLRDAIEYVSAPADDLTRRTQAGHDGGEHKARYDDSSNDEHVGESPRAHSQSVDAAGLVRKAGGVRIRNVVRGRERERPSYRGEEPVVHLME